MDKKSTKRSGFNPELKGYQPIDNNETRQEIIPPKGGTGERPPSPPPQHPERNNQYRIQKVLKDRNSAINILLIKYLESTGYEPEDIIMCQSSKITKEGHIFKTWFEKKGEK